MLPQELRAPSDLALPLQEPIDKFHAENASEGTWESLVNQLLQRWDASSLRLPDEDFYGSLPPLELKAVILWDLQRHVYNGGFGQWIRNDYCEWIDEIVVATGEIGTHAAMEVQAIVKSISSLLQTGQATEDQWETVVSDCTDRYYHVMADFSNDVDRWLATRMKH
jgi:hypothetical protein